MRQHAYQICKFLEHTLGKVLIVSSLIALVCMFAWAWYMITAIVARISFTYEIGWIVFSAILTLYMIGLLGMDALRDEVPPPAWMRPLFEPYVPKSSFSIPTEPFAFVGAEPKKRLSDHWGKLDPH